MKSGKPDLTSERAKANSLIKLRLALNWMTSVPKQVKESSEKSVVLRDSAKSKRKNMMPKPFQATRIKAVVPILPETKGVSPLKKSRNCKKVSRPISKRKATG